MNKIIKIINRINSGMFFSACSIGLVVGGANAQQWTGNANTTDPIYRAGSVGIGTTAAPASGIKLQVTGGNILLDNWSGLLGQSSVGGWSPLISNTDGGVSVGNNKNTLTLIGSNTSTGEIKFNVGPGGTAFKATAAGFSMGVATALAKLHVNEGTKPTAIFDNASTAYNTVIVNGAGSVVPTLKVTASGNSQTVPAMNISVGNQTQTALQTSGAITAMGPIYSSMIGSTWGIGTYLNGAITITISTPTFYSVIADSVTKIYNGTAATKYLSIGISRGNQGYVASSSICNVGGYVLASYDSYNGCLNFLDEGTSFNASILPYETLCIIPVKTLLKQGAASTDNIWVKVLQ